MSKVDTPEECEFPSGLDGDETSRYMLTQANPDALAEQIDEAVAVLAATTLAELDEGKPLSMDTIYEAAKKLEANFPTPSL